MVLKMLAHKNQRTCQPPRVLKVKIWGPQLQSLKNQGH